MDRDSHRLANVLVGNPADAAAFEATLIGPKIRINDPAVISVTGADVDARLDGAAIPMGEPVRCRKDTVLAFGDRRSGARVYIAFDGGLDVPPMLGSRATHLVSAIGAFGGRPLRSGDVVALGLPTGEPPRRRSRDRAAPPVGGARLRVMCGPQEEFFDPEGLDVIQRTRFVISAQSDRMGYRLHAPLGIRRRPGLEMISDVTFMGSIQVPPSGDPILLMADRPTTGGYPQIATVITADLPIAGQLAPGDWVEFSVCTRAEALTAHIAQENKLLAIA
jgi:antagonist of KipI